MNVGVRSAKIAQGLREPILHGFKYKPAIPQIPPLFSPCAVASGVDFGRSDGETKFEWHIEPWRPRPRAIHLDPGEIVNRIAATANKLQYLLQPVASAGDFDCRVGIEAKISQAGNIGEIETAERAIIWNIEKDGVSREALRPSAHDFSSSLLGRMLSLLQSSSPGSTLIGLSLLKWPDAGCFCH